jgi:hypothetical protein
MGLVHHLRLRRARRGVVHPHKRCWKHGAWTAPSSFTVTLTSRELWHRVGQAVLMPGRYLLRGASAQPGCRRASTRPFDGAGLPFISGGFRHLGR